MPYSNIKKYFCIGVHLLQDILKTREWLTYFFLVKVVTVKELFGNLVKMNVRYALVKEKMCTGTQEPLTSVECYRLRIYLSHHVYLLKVLFTFV